MKNTCYKEIKKYTCLVTCSILFSSFIFSQGIGVNETSEEPDPSAILDVSSSTKGFLPPRMTTEQRDAIENPAEGLVIYNLTLHCLEYWNGTSWFNWCDTDTPVAPTPSVFCSGTPTEVVEVTNPTTGKIWMDRNLGATQVATSSTDQDAYGDLYQWGRFSDGHQCRNSSTTTVLSSTDQPDHGDFILAPNSPRNWRNPENNNLWQGSNGINNPCPNGFQIPSEAELEAERTSWVSADANGAFSSPLKLTVGGFRDFGSGSFDDVGEYGFYWSSTINGLNAKRLIFWSNAFIDTIFRAEGYSIRCIKS